MVPGAGIVVVVVHERGSAAVQTEEEKSAARNSAAIKDELMCIYVLEDKDSNSFSQVFGSKEQKKSDLRAAK
uniref:Uncharacterized protein n=1 Tax=Cucumis melo TaxID=3656 RepID=A0A9I9DMP9_CUCME